ncbi:MAG TPA: glycosyltransferase family 2 protein [Candidatus Acidoferrum sp.]|nr:glycosyltransferase family 2 protein [Candidatus Acidoferrum sp.]
MIRVLEISNQALFWYYLATNFAYLAMLIIALKTSAMHQRRLESHRLSWFKDTPMTPPITIIAPAHNEEASIRVAIRNLLELDYPQLEIIVVNDGSRDRTLEELRDEFRLRAVRAVYVAEIKSARVRGLHRSDIDSRLLVVDKDAGGSKADAVNAGLNAATSPYVCIVDSDSVLERDALLRIMVPILEDPKRVVAVGGIIRVLNGSEIVNGQLRRVRLPRKSIEAIQVIEYLRAFLIGREAWAQGNMLTIISGAFGLFRTDLVRAVGGYRASSIGEDMDVVARMHRHLRERTLTTKSVLCPIPCAGRKFPRTFVHSHGSGRAGRKACWTFSGPTATCSFARATAESAASRFPISGSLNYSPRLWKSSASRQSFLPHPSAFSAANSFCNS